MKVRRTHVVLEVLAVLVTAQSMSAQSAPNANARVNGTPKFAALGGATPGPNSRTVPHWSFTFTDPTNNVTYPITMVGTDPAAGGSTLITAEIIPLKIRFSNGAVLDGSNRAAAVQSSPLFNPATFNSVIANSATGQYGDVFMRAQFNKLNSAYHVNLTLPAILPTVTIDVPQNQGQGFSTGDPAFPGIGLVDAGWMAPRLQNLLGQLHIDETTLAIFLTDNVMLYDKTIDNCCIIGFHSASRNTNTNGSAPIQTMIFASYTAPGTFGVDPNDGLGIQDIHALSHELSEWLDDPFVNNAVQPWLTPTAPQYGCTSLLETGDPVVGIWFPLPGNPDNSFFAGGVWHPEDEVFWPWFLRQSPSSSFNGHYTLMGPLNPFPGFQQPATGCH
jgi:hypothetical protein